MKRSIPLVPALLLMIATLLVALVVVRVAFALDSDAARFEAETMSEDSGRISVVNDNGTQALRFVKTPASASKSVSFSAIAQMAMLRVRGVDTSGGTRTLPSVRVTVDGAQVLSQQVSGSYSTLMAPTSLGAGTHTVSVNLTNWDTGDRIFVDWIAFTYSEPPPPPPSQCSEGEYLATYRNEAAGQFGTTSPVLTRCEAAPLAYDLGAGSPAPGVNADNFTAVWKGDLDFEGADYEFTARADDGIRVYIDGERILDEWRDQGAADFRTTRTLTAGTHEVRIEYYENGVDSVAKLSWVKLAAPPLPPTTPPPLPTDSPSGSLSITDFGATPNDTTDDTAAINRAISAARSQGKGVFVPAGTFRHRAFMLDGVKMHGTGDNSLLYAPDPTVATIDLRGDNPQLKDLKVQTPSNTRIVNQDAVRTHDAIDFLIQNVTVDGSNAAGIIMGVSGPGKVLNNRVINTKADAIHMTDATHDMVVDGNTVRNSGDDMIAVVSYRYSPVPLSQNILIQNNNVDDGDTRGITVVGGKNVTIQNNTIGHTPHGAGVYLAAEEPWNTFGVENILVRNNTLNFNDGAPEHHGAILAVAFEGYGPNQRIHIDNNTINNPFAYGVALEGDNRSIAVTNNKMYNVPHVPIHVIDHPDWTDPTNVYCAGNQVDGSAYTKNCGGSFNFSVTGSTLMYP
jgi:hypothetical protein